MYQKLMMWIALDLHRFLPIKPAMYSVAPTYCLVQ